MVAAIALGVASVSMWKVHQMSAPEPVITVNQPQAPPEFTPKTLTYEVFGAPGRAAC
ncbi:conserved membrane family protein [Mycobacteroides abscessus MAB_030201_1061]|uniref:Conserved membrane family protein n=1 Tax=Mycobacteroides abscessus 21 TaxID=1299324 RepID=A0A829Q0N4_9MYCO|nr:conserved membrane family protein [Mycobacteroides abscessus MAB_030201_1061]EUA46340.1 conserved membrane family protein [Mycobacteroides abscessus 21]